MSSSPIPITTGSGQASVATDLVSNNNYQQIKVVDGTLGSITPLKVNADGSITASVYGNISVTPAANQSVSGTVQAQIQGSVATVIIGGSIAASFTPPANQSVSGTIGASVIGITPVNLVSANGGQVVGTGTNGNDSLTSTIGINTASFGYVFNGTSWDMQRGNKTIGALVTPYQFPSSLVSGVTSVITGTSSVQVLAPAAAAQRNYITNVLVTNAAAVGTTVQLFDGGNVIYAGYAAASGGGFAVSFPAPLKQASIAGNLSALSTVQASVFVSASGYTAA